MRILVERLDWSAKATELFHVESMRSASLCALPLFGNSRGFFDLN